VAVWALGKDWSAKNWLTFDFDKGAQKLQRDLEWLEHGNAPEKMDAFRQKGGKLLLFSGWADPNLSPDHIANLYESLETRAGAVDRNAFVRLFMVPGMYHCRAGPGPNDFGQSTRANQSGATPDNDLVLALDRWVAEGVGPERIVASKYVDDDISKGVIRTRPLCAYPKVARWIGRGSTDDAKNFVCAAPR
jgi:feruloyl esterase